MDFFVPLVLFNIFIRMPPVISMETRAEGIYYGSLITDIYYAYPNAGIIISASETSYRNFRKLTVEHDISRMLSRERIPSLIVSFTNFEERLTFYTDRLNRSLMVILFRTMKDVHTFKEIAKDLTLSDAIWLILFLGQSGQDMCDYCRNPYNNLLNLRFDSQVFVSCCESDIIEEWWSSKVNSTRRQEIGRWIDEDRRIEWTAKKDLYSRRNSLEGRALRIAASKGSAYIWEKDGKYYGFFGEILNELALTMNFTVPKLIWEDSYGNFDTDMLKWSGVIGKIKRNEADIGVSPFCMTGERLGAVDFTVPMAVGESRLYVKKLDGARIQWKAYFKAFAMDVWIVIIGMILIMPLFLTLIKYKKNDNFLSLLIEHYLCVWGIYCQQGLAKFPEATPLRIVYLSIFISAVVTASVYSASLVSFLTVFSSYSPFNTIEEFVEDGTYEFVILAGSAQHDSYKNSNDTFIKVLISLMKPRESLPSTIKEGFHQVCNGGVAFETNEANKRAVGNSIFCELTHIDMGKIETFGMIAPRQSEYLAFINHRIRQFQNNGMFQRLEYKYLREPLQNEPDYPKVHVEGIKPILYTLAGGSLITVIIFVIEITLNWSITKLCDFEIRRIIKRKVEYFRFSRKKKNVIDLLR